MILRKIAVILILTILVGQASAAEYSADLKVEKYQSGSWVSDTRTLNVSGIWSVFDISIKYKDINSNYDRIYFEVTGTDVRDTTPLIEEGKTACIRYAYETCFPGTNATPQNGAVKLTLVDIKPFTSGFTNISGDNPIYVYLYSDKEISIPKSTNNGADIRTFDAKQASTNTGWSGSVSPSEVYVYFQRRENAPVSISLSTDVPTKPKEEWSSDKAKFTITANGKYIFTVKYDKSNIWGAKTEVTEVYGFNLVGMAGSTAQSATPRGVFDVYLPDAKILELGENVKITETPTGVTVSPMGGKEYRFTFSTTGNYRVKYTANGVEDYADFGVHQSPAPAATPLTQALTGSQAQGKDSGDGGGTDWWLVGIIGIALVGVVITGFWWKGKSKGPKTHGKFRVD